MIVCGAVERVVDSVKGVAGIVGVCVGFGVGVGVGIGFVGVTWGDWRAAYGIAAAAKNSKSKLAGTREHNKGRDGVRQKVYRKSINPKKTPTTMPCTNLGVIRSNVRA